MIASVALAILGPFGTVWEKKKKKKARGICTVLPIPWIGIDTFVLVNGSAFGL